MTRRLKPSDFTITLRTDDPTKGEPASSDGYARVAFPGYSNWPTIKFQYLKIVVDGVEHVLPECRLPTCRTIAGLGAHAHHPHDFNVVFQIPEEAS